MRIRPERNEEMDNEVSSQQENESQELRRIIQKTSKLFRARTNLSEQPLDQDS